MAIDLNSIINKQDIKSVSTELLRRRSLLIKFAHNKAIPMDELHRECIISFLEKWETPKKPDDIPGLMKKFFTSCFSYAPLRKYLTSIAGSTPTPDMLPPCLFQIYSEKSFLVHNNWQPKNLYTVVDNIQKSSNYDLKSNEFKPRMISVMRSGSIVMNERLKNGLASFYKELDEINNKPANDIWDYLSEFPKNIHNVGSALICDFIKGIGYEKFVKVDHHFKKELPQLLGFSNCNKLTAKEHFILSQDIAKLLNISPFHFDHLLYQWGRYKKYENLA